MLDLTGLIFGLQSIHCPEPIIDRVYGVRQRLEPHCRSVIIPRDSTMELFVNPAARPNENARLDRQAQDNYFSRLHDYCGSFAHWYSTLRCISIISYQ